MRARALQIKKLCVYYFYFYFFFPWAGKNFYLTCVVTYSVTLLPSKGRRPRPGATVLKLPSDLPIAFAAVAQEPAARSQSASTRGNPRTADPGGLLCSLCARLHAGAKWEKIFCSACVICCSACLALRATISYTMRSLASLSAAGRKLSVCASMCMLLHGHMHSDACMCQHTKRSQGLLAII